MNAIHQRSLGNGNSLEAIFEARNEIQSQQREDIAKTTIHLLLKHLKKDHQDRNDQAIQHCIVESQINVIKVNYDETYFGYSDTCTSYHKSKNCYIEYLENLVLELCSLIYYCSFSNQEDIKYYYCKTYMKMNDFDEESKLEIFPKIEEESDLSKLKLVLSSKNKDIQIKAKETLIKKLKAKWEAKNIFQRLYSKTKQFCRLNLECFPLHPKDFASSISLLNLDLQILLEQKKEIDRKIAYHNLLIMWTDEEINIMSSGHDLLDESIQIMWTDEDIQVMSSGDDWLNESM